MTNKYEDSSNITQESKEMPEKEPEIDAEDDAVPFTARLMAHYRATENKHDNPLFVDPLAELLAGDMAEYAEEHKRTAGSGDYSIVRSFYIEQTLLTSWCESQENSQIILMGAGLDTRAYRFSPLKKNRHTVFEIDFPVVNQYKEKVLRNEKPLCKLVRVSANLSKPDWTTHLLESGFSKDIPSFWILEGLVYYIEQDVVRFLLARLNEISSEDSQIFADVCIPALADLVYGPFTRHFKWGLDKKKVPVFFAKYGWNVSCSYADDFDQGRDVGQKGLMFVHGRRGRLEDIEEGLEEVTTSEDFEVLTGLELQAFAIEVARMTIPEIKEIVEIYRKDPDEGLSVYVAFIKSITASIERMIKGLPNVASVGQISPRLLRDPLSSKVITDEGSSEEKETHVVGYLKAILQLIYCVAKGLEGWQFRKTALFVESEKTRDVGTVDVLPSLIQIVKREIFEG